MISTRFTASGNSKHVMMTPLIDVVFILLIFFILETDFLKPKSVQMDLPRHGNTAKSDFQTLTIELHESGTLWLGGRQIASAELSGELKILALDPDTNIVIATDYHVDLQRVVHVMDILGQNGLEEFSLRKAQRFEN